MKFRTIIVLGIVLLLVARFHNKDNPVSGSGAETIEQCGAYFIYLDMSFMAAHTNNGCMGTRYPTTGRALGFTTSLTPPDAPVEYIDEISTTCFGVGPKAPVVVSTGRHIARKAVQYKQYDPIEYDMVGGQRCTSYRFTPPKLD